MSVQTKNSSTLRDVENFWSANPCNSSQGKSANRVTWFMEIESDRYSNEPHILEITDFNAFNSKRVLEIGCGVGTDGRRFAQAGAHYTGINLDNGSARLAREAMDLFQLPATICQMDAERPAFAPHSFDHVYSFGVIHHSPAPHKIVGHINHILHPGGTTTIMVYHRNSINYLFEIMFLRKILRYALVPTFAPRLLSRMLGLNESKLQRHREIMLEGNMTKDRWISINTDGPDCPLARVYSRAQGTQLLADAGFTNITTSIHFFDKRHYGKLGSLIPDTLVRWLGTHLGWHLVIKAQKPTP